jgi:hypothetical protein
MLTYAHLPAFSRLPFSPVAQLGTEMLDGTTRWQSKLEGVPDAGVGMHVFIARAAIGGGATAPTWSTLHLQLDKTTGENKNATVFGFMALLVHWGVFAEAVVFFMPKSTPSTFNLLDQT